VADFANMSHASQLMAPKAAAQACRSSCSVVAALGCSIECPRASREMVAVAKCQLHPRRLASRLPLVQVISVEGETAVAEAMDRGSSAKVVAEVMVRETTEKEAAVAAARRAVVPVAQLVWTKASLAYWMRLVALL